MTTLALLPGMDGTGDLFAPLISALDGSFEVTVARYPRDPALGYSQLEPNARSACPTNGHYFLLGESFSGPLAIQIAATNPKGLLGIILCATFATNPRPRLGPLGKAVTLLPVWLAPSPLVSFALLGRFATPRLRQAITAAVRSVSSRAMRARLHSVLAVNVLADLARIRVPILYLRASVDRIVPIDSLSQICNSNPAVQVINIAGPHCVLQASPRQAAAAINAFIAHTSNNL